MAGMPAGYGQFCPIAKASEIFAARWTPLILRELMAGMRAVNRGGALSENHRDQKRCFDVRYNPESARYGRGG